MSQEQLYRTGKAAAGLGREVEEMISDVREYLQGIADSLTPENCFEAAEQAVLKLEGEASAAIPAAQGELRHLCSGRDMLNILAEAMDKRKDALQAVLERGLEIPVQRALRLLTMVVAFLEEALCARANLEEWDRERLQQ